MSLCANRRHSGVVVRDEHIVRKQSRLLPGAFPVGRLRSAVHLVRGQSVNAVRAIDVLWPPKPKALLRAAVTSRSADALGV